MKPGTPHDGNLVCSWRSRVMLFAAPIIVWMIGSSGCATPREGMGWTMDEAVPVRSCSEAGRDGFWLHRWLRSVGIANEVVDSASIEVKRRARQVKTDRVAVEK